MTRIIKMSLLSWILVVGMLLSANMTAFAQSEIKGIVYDTDKSMPMIGAMVIVEGTNVASMTDIDGKFILKAKEGDVLLVQFMGYIDQKIKPWASPDSMNL